MAQENLKAVILVAKEGFREEECFNTKNVLEKAGLPALKITKPNVDSEQPHQETGGSCCSH